MFEAMVLDVREERRNVEEARWQLLLDRSELRPGDTGTLEAVSRGGVRLRLRVFSVIADDAGQLWHVVEKPLGAGTVVCGWSEPEATG